MSYSQYENVASLRLVLNDVTAASKLNDPFPAVSIPAWNEAAPARMSCHDAQFISNPSNCVLGNAFVLCSQELIGTLQVADGSV
jgi:hypothetical protein